MKNRLFLLLTAFVLMISLCACSGGAAENGDPQGEPETGENAEDILGKNENAGGEGTEQESGTEATDGFSFKELECREFWFGSGAGGWSTVLSVNADGTFSGEYHDSEMGDASDEYPNGTVYICDFTGEFTAPVKVNDYTYSVQISKLECEQEKDAEEIVDGIRYVGAEAFGMDSAENILIYLPGAPLDELPVEYRSWVGYLDLDSTEETELPYYGLYNETPQYGFSSYWFGADCGME